MNMISIAKAFQMVEDQRRQEAKKMHHKTLLELIDMLSAIDPNKICVIEGSVNGNPHNAHSYRGFYTDLSINPDLDADVLVIEVLDILRNALWNTFEGWKGGWYTMRPDTLVWVAEEGTSNDDAIVDVIEEPFAVVLVTAKTQT